jgi:crotonobetainyl-CoA:carnitine CoA-transferase CaiB-like acyl-CoA transferase
LIDDERFASVPARAHNNVERRQIMSAEIAKWPSAEILDRLRAESVPCGPVLSRTEVLSDEQVLLNDTIEVCDDPVLGPVRQPRPAARFSETPAGIQRLAPYLGAHNAEIMAELGYSASDVEHLTRAGVLITQPVPSSKQ